MAGGGVRGRGLRDRGVAQQVVGRAHRRGARPYRGRGEVLPQVFSRQRTRPAVLAPVAAADEGVGRLPLVVRFQGHAFWQQAYLLLESLVEVEASQPFFRARPGEERWTTVAPIWVSVYDAPPRLELTLPDKAGGGRWTAVRMRGDLDATLTLDFAYPLSERGTPPTPEDVREIGEADPLGVEALVLRFDGQRRPFRFSSPNAFLKAVQLWDRAIWWMEKGGDALTCDAEQELMARFRGCLLVLEIYDPDDGRFLASHHSYVLGADEEGAVEEAEAARQWVPPVFRKEAPSLVWVEERKVTTYPLAWWDYGVHFFFLDTRSGRAATLTRKTRDGLWERALPGFGCTLHFGLQHLLPNFSLELEGLRTDADGSSSRNAHVCLEPLGRDGVLRCLDMCLAGTLTMRKVG